MKILDLIHASAVKGGLQSDDAELKSFLATPLTPETVIPKKIADSINGLMNVESAKNNPLVVSALRPSLLGPIDDKFLSIAQQAELEAEGLEALKAEKSSYVKQDILNEKLLDKIKKLKEAKKEGDSDRVKTLDTEITLLRQTIKDKDAEIARIRQEAVAQVNSFIENEEITKAFGSYEWSDLYSPDLRDILARTKLQQELSKLGGKIAIVDNKLKLVRADNPGMDLYDSAQNLVTLKDVAGRVMSESKFLKVASPPVTQTIAGKANTQTPPVNNAEKLPTVAEKQLAALDAELGINP